MRTRPARISRSPHSIFVLNASVNSKLSSNSSTTTILHHPVGEASQRDASVHFLRSSLLGWQPKRPFPQTIFFFSDPCFWGKSQRNPPLTTLFLPSQPPVFGLHFVPTVGTTFSKPMIESSHECQNSIQCRPGHGVACPPAPFWSAEACLRFSHQPPTTNPPCNIQNSQFYPLPMKLNEGE